MVEVGGYVLFVRYKVREAVVAVADGLGCSEARTS